MKKRNKANHIDENVFVSDIWDSIRHFWRWQKKNEVPESNAVWIFEGRTWKRIGYINKNVFRKVIEKLPVKDKKLFDDLLEDYETEHE